MTARTPNPSFRELFTPKLVTILRAHYRFAELRADVVAGFTVAIVAMPLSMAIAIASGVTPDRGLYAAIVGGFIVSLLGGSRFQIGGPAGAFIVLVAATVARHGVDGLILATMLSGLIMMGAGFLRLGAFIKYIPYPVTVGFTAGIAMVIFASQIRDLMGLTLVGDEPGAIIPKIQALSAALPSANMAAIAIAALCIGVIILIRRVRPHWPAFVIAIVLAAVLVWYAGFPVETIGTRFGGIPGSLPAPRFPVVTIGKLVAVLPDALSFALLGSIESLLSAVVADSMTGRRHRSNVELVAQGAANMASSLFGGICVTGTIARTATNVRAGAHGPVAGMLHSVFLLLFMLLAAPLASYIPLAALAAVLTMVCWNMAEKHEFSILLRASRGDAVVLLVTFLLVIFRDLSQGIVVGFALGALLFVHRMAQSVEVERGAAMAEDDEADIVSGKARDEYDAQLAADPDILVYRISGAFFFGAAAAVIGVIDRIGEQPKAYVIDFSAVRIIDSTAAAAISGLARKAARQGAVLYIAGTGPPVRRMLFTHGVRAPLATFKATIDQAVAAARGRISSAPADRPED